MERMARRRITKGSGQRLTRFGPQDLIENARETLKRARDALAKAGRDQEKQRLAIWLAVQAAKDALYA
jgi:hypothetical protein